jgi:hypothetical protein
MFLNQNKEHSYSYIFGGLNFINLAYYAGLVSRKSIPFSTAGGIGAGLVFAQTGLSASNWRMPENQNDE